MSIPQQVHSVPRMVAGSPLLKRKEKKREKKKMKKKNKTKKIINKKERERVSE